MKTATEALIQEQEERTHHFTFREAMEFIKRDQRRQFWMSEAAQVFVVILLALALGFALGLWAEVLFRG